MTSGYSVTPDDLHAAGAAMDQAGGNLHAQWEQLKAQTMAIQFGQTDVVAPLIQMTLMGAVAVADSCFGSSHDALGSHADGLRKMATQYQSTEDDTSSMFKAE
jgi:uncharacterized protein YukE